METWLPIIIQLISGAVGGIGAGAALKNQSLGTIGNAIAGVVGGGLGGQLLGLLGVAAGGGMDVGSIAGSVAGGGVGGAVLMIVVGLINKALGTSGNFRNPPMNGGGFPITVRERFSSPLHALIMS